MTNVLIGVGTGAYVLGMTAVVFFAMRMMWHSIAKPFPPQPIEEDAVCRSFQSASIGLFNLGFCVGITVDSAYLHLTPNFILKLTTHRTISIPWDQITPGKYSFFKRYRSFKIASHTVTVPAWALNLAEPTPQGEPHDSVE